MNKAELIKIAKTAAEKAYVPYSKHNVGAALLCKNGKIYTGCNIENAAYGPTNCAERTAFFKAISEGEKEFESIAIVGGVDMEFKHFCYPCGVCRQVMSEFCDDNFEIILWKDSEEYATATLKELLPERFTRNNLK